MRWYSKKLIRLYYFLSSCWAKKSRNLFSKHIDRFETYYLKWFSPLKTDYTDQQCGVLRLSWVRNVLSGFWISHGGRNYPWREESAFSSGAEAGASTYRKYLLLLLFIVIFFRIKRRDKIIIIIISAFGWLGLDCGRSEILLASRRVKYSVVDERNIPASVSRHRGPDEQDEVFDSRAQPLHLLSVLPKPLQQRRGSLISDYPEVFECINHFFDFFRRVSLFRPGRWIV